VWNAYLGVILSVATCEMVSLIISQDLFICLYHNGLGFHCSLQLSL
jgi:hypothetical protein